MCLLSNGPGAASSPQRPHPGHRVPCGGVWPCVRRWSWVLLVGRNPRTESEVRSGLDSLLLPPTVKQRSRGTSSTQRTWMVSRQREQGPGTTPSTQQSSHHCQGEPLWSGHCVWCGSPAPLRAHPSTDHCRGLRSGGVAGDKDA